MSSKFITKCDVCGKEKLHNKDWKEFNSVHINTYPGDFCAFSTSKTKRVYGSFDICNKCLFDNDDEKQIDKELPKTVFEKIKEFISAPSFYNKGDK